MSDIQESKITIERYLQQQAEIKQKYNPLYLLNRAIRVHDVVLCRYDNLNSNDKNNIKINEWAMLLRLVYQWDYNDISNTSIYFQVNDDILYGGVYNIRDNEIKSRTILSNLNDNNCPYIYTLEQWENIKRCIKMAYR